MRLLLLVIGALPVYAQYRVDTIAGGYVPNRVAATSVSLGLPTAVVTDSAGNTYIAAAYADLVVKVDSSGNVSPVAGTGVRGFSGDRGPATGANLNTPSGLALDTFFLYIADSGNQRIRRVAIVGGGIIDTIAGTGKLGSSGDGGLATQADLFLQYPTGLALDGGGTTAPASFLYFSDTNTHRVRRINLSTLTISTVAGTGKSGFDGDGRSATSSSLASPTGIAITNGNLYIADTFNQRVRRVILATGVMDTIAGNGVSGFSGDSGLATSANLSGPVGLGVDSTENLYIAERNNHRVRRVDAATNRIATVAGNGDTTCCTANVGADGGQANATSFLYPVGLALDRSGNLIIADSTGERVRRVTISTGIISTVAGNGSARFDGDGGPGVLANFDTPLQIAVDSVGNLYVADTLNHRIRRIQRNGGQVTTIAGEFAPCQSNLFPVFPDEIGTPNILLLAPEAPPGGLCRPHAVTIDSAGNIYFPSYAEIQRLSVTGTLVTVAGNHVFVDTGDGGPATSANVYEAIDLTTDSIGNLYFVTGNARVRKIDVSTGVIDTVAGNGTAAFTGDGGPAARASLNDPSSVVVDRSNNIYISEMNRIRRVDGKSGVITTFAGNGLQGYSGDGGIATNATLSDFAALALDVSGNLYVADSYNNCIRRVDAVTRVISTIAGTGPSAGFSGDGGPALNAKFRFPSGLAVDGAGNIYVSDTGNNRIRQLTPLNLTLSTTILAFTVGGSQTVSVDSAGGPLTFSAFASTDSGVNWLRVSPSSGATPAILTITAQTGQLPPGVYTGTITIAAPQAANNPQIITVTLTIANLTISTGTISFSSAGSQNFTVGSTLPGLALSASARTDSGGNWLSVTPISGSSPSTLTVSATSGALSPGTYSGTVTITSPNAANSPQNVRVTLVVGVATAVSANPQALTFQSPIDSIGVPSQTIQLSSVTPNATFTVQSIPDAWLAVTPTTGQLPSRLSVSVNVVGLAAGTYTSKIAVQSPGNPNLVIPVTLVVQQLPSNAFDVQAPDMQFRVGVNTKDPLSRLISVQSHTDQNLTIRAQTKGGSRWLSVSPSQAPVGPGQQIDFQAVVTPPVDVAAGADSVKESIVITGGGQSKEVPVTVFFFDGTLPQPVVSSRGVTLATIQGQNNHDSKDLLLYNAGSSSLNWSLTQTSIYLSVSQILGPPLAPGGFKSFAVTTTANVGDLTTPPTPTPSLLFQGWGLSPDVSEYIPVPVYIQLLDPNIFPRLPPRASTAGIIVGPPGFVQQTVKLLNSGTQPANFAISAPDWLSVTSSARQVPANGSLDLTVALLRQPMLDPKAPPPAITIEFTNFGNRPYDTNIDVVYVSPPSGSTPTTTKSEQAAVASCSPTRYSAVFASPGNLFEVPAALPVDVIARVVDDCGNALASGAAIVTFSNGESAIALSAWPDGTWRGTWQPLLPQNGLVTLRLVATATNNMTPARAIIGGSIVASGNAPIVLSNSVLNSASQQKNNDTIAPGQIISIYGQNLATRAQSAANGIPPTTLGGIQVLLGGNPLSLFYVGPTQINAVVPFTVPVRQSLQLIVQRNGTPSVPLPLTVVAAQPGIFTTSQTGSGQGAIVGPSGQIADSQNPAHRGDIVSIYCEGLGAVDQPVDVTVAAPSREPLPRVTGQLTVIIGNSSSEVFYAGLAPGYHGLYQINVRVPANAPLGDAVPVQINVGNQPSNTAVVALR
jgi:uncharacterized protein (TIGR03437 family)